MIEKIKNNKQLVLISIPLFILVIILAIKIIYGQELIIDKFAYDILVGKLRNPTLTHFMKLITKLSNTEFIVSLAAFFLLVFLYIIKNKKLAVTLTLNLIGVASLNQFLKAIFQRERPVGYRLIEMTGYSFPSGHAMVSMSFYGLLIYIIHRLFKNKKLKILLISLNVIIIILVGLSRIYLGVHYFSDVIAGYSISIIYLLLVTKFLNKYKVFP